VDFGSRTVNKMPKLWGGDSFVSEPLQYRDSVRNGIQKVYDKSNEWSGYEPPELVDGYDTILYGTSELAGELIVPVGIYTKWGGLITKAPTLGGVAASAWGGIKTIAGGLLKHGKIPTALVALDASVNDLDATQAIVGKAADLIANQMEEYNDAPNTHGEIIRDVRPSRTERKRGPRDTADPKVKDHYNSWMDGIETAIGLNIPDGFEGFADGGLTALANSKFGDWLGGGSLASKLAIGLPALFASNALLDKILGNSMMSGIMSIGLAAIAAYTLPKMFNNAANPGATTNDFTANNQEAQEALAPTLVPQPELVGVAAQ
jgi:hypothetical protein